MPENEISIYRLNNLPRVRLVADSFSQLSATMNKPAYEKPVINLIAHQMNGFINIACKRMDVDARDASAPKIRICPTRLTKIGMVLQPNIKPRKYPDIINPVIVVPKFSIEARTPIKVDCRPFPIIISPMPSSSAQQLEIVVSIL